MGIKFDNMKEEICESCGRIIGIAEQAYVYEGRIACEQCDKKLRQEDRQDRKSPDAEDTWLNRKSEELVEALEAQEHKEILELQQPQESKGPQEARELEELEELKEPEEPQESHERRELLEFQEAKEPTEFQGPKAGPVEAEEGADVPDVPAAKPLSRRRKRVSTTESTLLPLLLAAWSLLCVFLLFYVPGRYVSLLQINAFGYEDRTFRFAVECLMLFFMVLWFFGALGLYVSIIGYDKEEKTNEKLRTLRLLGF